MISEISRHIDSLKSIITTISVSAVSSISAAFYILVTVLSIDQADNLANTKIKLPIIGSDTSLFSFYIWSTIILLFFHLQMIERLAALASVADRVSRVLTLEHPIRSDREEAVRFVSRWSLVFYLLRDRRQYSRRSYVDLFRIYFTFIPLVTVFPLTILSITIISLPLHDNLVTNISRICFFATTTASIWINFRIINRNFSMISIVSACIHCLILGFSILLFLGLFTFPGESFISKERLISFYKFDAGLLRQMRGKLYGHTYMGSRIISNIIVIKPDANSHKSDNSFDFSNVNFVGRNLIGLRLQKVNLTRSNFSKADLTDSQLDSIKFDNTIFQSANLRNANITKSEGIDISFSKANLQNVFLSQNDFTRPNFTEATIFNSKIINVSLVGADFTKSDMYDIFFRESAITSGKFFQTTIIDSIFQKVDWQLSTFDSSVLLKCQFFDLYAIANNFRHSAFILNNFLVSNISFIDFIGSTNIDNVISGSNIEKINYSNKVIQPLNMSIVKDDLYRFSKKCHEIGCIHKNESFKEISDLISRTLSTRCQSPGCETFSLIFQDRIEFTANDIFSQTYRILCKSSKRSEIIKYFVSEKRDGQIGFLAKNVMNDSGSDIFKNLRTAPPAEEIDKKCAKEF